MGITKRWPKRREFLAYYMLLLYAKNNNLEEINAGEAIDVLYLLTGSKRLASRLLRALVRQGYLERVRPLVYRVKDIDSVLGRALGHYLANRLKRRGIDAYYDEANIAIVLSDNNACAELSGVIESLGFRIKCIPSS